MCMRGCRSTHLSIVQCARHPAHPAVQRCMALPHYMCVAGNRAGMGVVDNICCENIFVAQWEVGGSLAPILVESCGIGLGHAHATGHGEPCCRMATLHRLMGNTANSVDAKLGVAAWDMELHRAYIVHEG
jgi:hypothetical protein